MVNQKEQLWIRVMLSPDFLFPRFLVFPLANPSNFSHCKCFSDDYSRTSIIRHGNSLKNNNNNNKISKMGVSAAVTMDTGMFIFCACADAHIHCCLSIKWVESRRGLSYSIIRTIQLSGMAQEQRCPDNRGSTVLRFQLILAAHDHYI